jgi:steroid 5-alpha reductase family enzyme
MAPESIITALLGLAAAMALAVVVWLRSLVRRDVSIVDSAWSLLVLAPALVAVARLPEATHRSLPLLLLGALWALRLAAHITWRHRGQPEDRRYQAIRARNQPNFERKSLYLVFGLQAVLAWIVSAPLAAAATSAAPWGWLDAIGLALFAFGFGFEAVADAQLARFKSDAAQRGQVLRTGLWRYSRHPNYFGECCLWWGLWLVALSAGSAWTVVSPLLMTWLLLKVSGVVLLEADIRERRPGYADYVARTNAFIPGLPRTDPR